MEIFEVTEGKGALCERILRALPDWFGLERAILEYIAAVERMTVLGAREDGEVLGFLALERKTAVTAEIHVMGVTGPWQRRGAGRMLVEAAASRATADGCRLLSVKTLAETRPDPHYDRTRAFYLSQDFLPVEIFPTLWDESNPCLLLVRILPQRFQVE